MLQLLSGYLTDTKKVIIKSAERDKRSSSFGDHKVFQLIDGLPIPDWKKFLGVIANKPALLKFLGDFVIRSHSQSSIVTSSDDELYLVGLFSDHQLQRISRLQK